MLETKTNSNKTAALTAEDFAPKQNPHSPAVFNENILGDFKLPEIKKPDLDFLHQAFVTKTEPNEDEKRSPIEKFLSEKLVKFTTVSSIIVNLLSVPVRLFDDNPLKKIINHISMFFTKFHLTAYSASGLFSAIRQKNPFLIFSYLTEGLAGLPFLGLRNIYLFRGIATGIDGAAAAVTDIHKKSEFSSYKEAWNHNIKTIKNAFENFYTKFTADPMHIFKLEGSDIAIFASLTAACGGIFGMTINEKVGGLIRDLFGAAGDYGVFKLNNSVARNSGIFYLAGSVLDLAARVFNKIVPGIVGVKDTSAFEKIRDAFHELSIAFDRAGQYFFQQYNQQSNKALAAT